MSLLAEILSSKWLIDPKYALGYFPLIKSLMDGMPLDLEKNFAEERLKQKPYLVSFNQNTVFQISEFGESTPPEDAPEGSIAVIPVQGVIRKNDGFCASGTNTKSNIFRRAENNPNIKSILLYIDSGGGQADGTENFSNIIKSSKKPVIAYVDGMAASAAYWIASAASKIVANGKTTEVGSIGTYVSFADFRSHYEKLGIKIIEVYAEQSTEKNKSIREALKGDIKLLEKELTEFNQYFIDAVKENRGAKINTEVADPFHGGMYLAETALKVGLIDQIGNFDIAVSSADIAGNEFLESQKQSSINLNTNNNNPDMKKLTLKAAWVSLLTFFGAQVPAGADSVEHEATEQDLEKLNADLTNLNSAVAKAAELEEKLNTAQSQISSLTSERDSFKTKFESAQAALEGKSSNPFAQKTDETTVDEDMSLFETSADRELKALIERTQID